MREPGLIALYRLMAQYHVSEEDLGMFIEAVDTVDGTDLEVMLDLQDLFTHGEEDTLTLTQHDLPLLAKALDDLSKAVLPDDGTTAFSQIYAAWLFACRKYGMRPQGAYYSMIPEHLWDYFNNCGPTRPRDEDNPYATPTKAQAKAFRQLKPKNWEWTKDVFLQSAETTLFALLRYKGQEESLLKKSALEENQPYSDHFHSHIQEVRERIAEAEDKLYRIYQTKAHAFFEVEEQVFNEAREAVRADKTKST